MSDNLKEQVLKTAIVLVGTLLFSISLSFLVVLLLKSVGIA